MPTVAPCTMAFDHGTNSLTLLGYDDIVDVSTYSRPRAQERVELACDTCALNEDAGLRPAPPFPLEFSQRDLHLSSVKESC